MQNASPTPLTPPMYLIQTRHGSMLANGNDFFIGRALLEYGEFSEIESQFIMQLVGGSGLVVEVGANIGAHSIAMAKTAAQNHQTMVVFEPQPVIFQNLCANLALNNIQNVRAWPFACGAEKGELHFPSQDYYSPGNFGGVSMQTEAGANTVVVPCVTLDEMLGGALVSLIKLDVEGFELSALQGAQRTIGRSRPVLYVENDRMDRSPALIEWIWSQDYRVWWHIPALFNPDNYFAKSENIYNNIASFNLLALPRERAVQTAGLIEVTDSAFHPLAKR
ncbi:FkbM family methyltransferase [Caballeronia humi]|uniref:FkbM family methyltransferase n=1 Tax=Caballeronia humi TaxID=326474 RepID=A0A158FYC8_9BURK|nr:FkbM family methyltransferase [Caballeronia humi]SAL24369.1 FkbM family methyltransferase [Caballeronia humi]